MHPFDIEFNIATMTIARRLFPTGYDVAQDAPQTLEALTAHIARTGRMLVSSVGSDNTIFACPEHNWAFRAWHDWHHWKHQLPFSPEGEALVAINQYIDLGRVYGWGDHRVPHWRDILNAEINGQIAFEQIHGHFPHNQRAFTEMYLRDPSAALRMEFTA